MKIITDNVAYVQKNDLLYLFHSEMAIPASIVNKMFGNGIVIVDDSNRYDFIKFEDEREIEFFKSLDWIIDYNEVKDLNKDNFIELGQSISDKKNMIAKEFNAMTKEEKQKNIDMVSQCELLDFKIYSLRDILWFKQGHIKFSLPDGIEEQPVKDIKNLLKSIFNKFKI